MFGFLKDRWFGLKIAWGGPGKFWGKIKFWTKRMRDDSVKKDWPEGA